MNANFSLIQLGNAALSGPREADSKSDAGPRSA